MTRRPDSTQDPRRRRTVVCEHLRINRQPVTDPAQKAALWGAIPYNGLQSNSNNSHHVRALPIMRCAIQNDILSPTWGTDVCLTTWGRTCPHKPVAVTVYRGTRPAPLARAAYRIHRPVTGAATVRQLDDARRILDRSERFGWGDDALADREQLALAILADHAKITTALAHYAALARGPITQFAQNWILTSTNLADWLASQSGSPLG